jgi:uncharacterized Ntn-hydrolase superfamily protein
MRIRRFGCVGLCIALGACAGWQRGQAREGANATAVLIVQRASRSLLEPSRFLVVVVRDVDEPDHVLQQAVVSLQNDFRHPESSAARYATTGDDGRALIEIPRAGEQGVLIRRIGYAPFQFVANLRSPCQEVLEVYIAKAANCLSECPPTPARAVLTTCPGLPPL